MRKKNYWKEACLLLVGLFLGMLFEKHYPTSLPSKKVITIEKDTIVYRDTIYATVVYPLNKKNVLAELKRQKVPHANIVLAQSKLETGGYTSKICKTHNNIFGLRKGNSYRKYNNYVACISDYKKLISSKYKGGNYYDFLEKLGYAEDPSYTKKLKNLV